MRSVYIGSVGGSSVTVLKEMIGMNFPVDMVFSLDEQYAGNVSGYAPIHEIAGEHGIPFKTFRRISDRENVEIIRDISPDYIFAIGLSQLVPKELIDCAKIGVVGFHPTPLPKFRGRAALSWQILLGVHETKCSMFFIDEGIDSGDILGQEPYTISDSDYVSDVSAKMNAALKTLTGRVLNQMLDGTLSPVKQNEDEATYLLARRPEDGLIDWQQSAESIHRLIRAVSHPYPGAFSMYDGEHKIIIWRAAVLENKKYIGIPGQICSMSKEYIDIFCKDCLIRITEWENIDDVRLSVGHKLK